MKYMNNNNQQYILSFLSETSNILNEVFDNHTNIKINNNIAIVTDLNEDSLFINQLKNNSINYYHTNYNNISDTISNKVVEEYVLVITTKDALITADLDLDFISLFLSKNIDYIFSTMSTPYPYPTDFSNMRCPLIPSLNKYINPCICFGYKDKVSEVFLKLSKSNTLFFNNEFFDSNSTIINLLFDTDIKIERNGDYDNLFFTSICHKVNYISEVENIRNIIKYPIFNSFNLII